MDNVEDVRETLGGIELMIAAPVLVEGGFLLLPVREAMDEKKKPQGKDAQPHWMRVVEDKEQINVHINEKGMVDKGPSPLIGVSMKSLHAIPGQREVGHFPPSHTPKGYDNHPDYTEHHAPLTSKGSPDKRVSGQPKAVAQATAAGAVKHAVASAKVKKLQDQSRKNAEAWARDRAQQMAAQPQQQSEDPSAPKGDDIPMAKGDNPGGEEPQGDDIPMDTPDASGAPDDATPAKEPDNAPNSTPSTDGTATAPAPDAKSNDTDASDSSSTDPDDTSDGPAQDSTADASGQQDSPSTPPATPPKPAPDAGPKVDFPTGQDGDPLPPGEGQDVKPDWPLSHNADKSLPTIMGKAKTFSEQKAAVGTFMRHPVSKSMPSDLRDAFTRHGYIDKSDDTGDGSYTNG